MPRKIHYKKKVKIIKIFTKQIIINKYLKIPNNPNNK